jgi:hypothetical protein
MIRNTTDLRTKHSALVYESELRQMAAVAAEWGQVETGGTLWGAFTHGGRSRIDLALPPGPGARHEIAFFQEDIDHVMHVARLLGRRFGLQIVGTYHNQHIYGGDPSLVDVRQVMSVSDRNHFDRWVQVICSFPACNDRQRRFHGRPAQPQSAARLPHTAPQSVRVDNYFYVDARRGVSFRAGLKVLRGISPIRKALIGSAILPEAALGYQCFGFPLDRINFDAAVADGASSAAPALPQDLRKQLEEVPASLGGELNIVLEDDLAVITMPLANEASALIVTPLAPPCPVVSVCIVDVPNARPREITGEVLADRKNMRIAQVCRWLMARPAAESHVRRTSDSAEDSEFGP